MKKTFFILIAIVVVLVAAISVFVFTFDANRYREQIEKEVSRALGHPVQIGNISLGWRGGLALEVDGVQVFSNDEPVLKVQNAGAVIQLAPLLRQNIRIASVFIDGADIRVVKDESGIMRVLGVTLPQDIKSTEAPLDKNTETVSATAVPPAMSSFLISQVNLNNLNLRYEDDYSPSPTQLDLLDLSLKVKNVSLFKPMEFEASGAFFGDKKNVNLRGIVKLENLGSEIQIDDLKLEVDLDLIEHDELARSLPQVMKDVPLTDWGGKLALQVSKLKIRDGKPESVRADIVLEEGFLETQEAGRFVQKINITSKNVSLSAPFEIQVKAAVFSGATNLSFQGRIEASNLGRVVIGPAQFDFDPQALHWAEMQARLPAIRDSGILAAPEGKLHVDIRRFTFEPEKQPVGDINFRYDQGRLRLKDLPQDLSQIQVTGNLRGNQLSLDAWNINYGNSPAEGRVNVQNVFTAPQFRVEARARNLNLKEMISPPPAPNQPSPEGVLSFDISLSGNGKIPEIILPSLAGSGSFQIENMVIRNLNVLEEIFSKISAIPGMNAALNQRMSDSLKARRERRDTPFEKISEEFFVERGVIRFSQFDAVSPDVKISGPVNVGLDSSVNARLVVLVHEEIMAELTERVHELAYALNKQGQLQIPLSVSGTVEQMSILPDIQQLLSEAVKNKAGQFLTDQLMKKNDGGERIDRLSQFLGTTTGAQSGSGQTAPASLSEPTDSSVPVKIYPTQQRQPSLLEALTGQPASPQSGSSQPSKTDIASGLINAFLSNNAPNTSSSSQSQAQN